MKLKLQKPLAVFDIESTGINPRTDRIVELAIIKLMPDGTQTMHCLRINPEMPIPAEVTALHGISDADVKDCPIFKDVASKLFIIFDGCDLAGYNLLRFDIPMLIEEFRRASLNFILEGRRVLDAQRIYHKREPRDLTAALAFYCNETHTGAHGAKDDTIATLRVIEGQLERYSDLPHDMDALDEYCNPRDATWADREGRFKKENGEILVNFGQKKGTSLKWLVRNDPGFLKWIIKSDFPSDTKELVQKALDARKSDPLGSVFQEILESKNKPVK